MEEIKFKLNGDWVEIKEDPTRRLLDLLRNQFNLLGVKEGCGEGECGACSVLIDHKLMNSCVTPIGNIINKEVTTIEGFAKTERFKVLEQAFDEQGAVQCGACTPGMLMASEALLHVNNHPTEGEIREALGGNLCRCTGYNMIVKAIQLASERGEHLW